MPALETQKASSLGTYVGFNLPCAFTVTVRPPSRIVSAAGLMTAKGMDGQLLRVIKSEDWVNRQ
jgi:hypothetical protein